MSSLAVLHLYTSVIDRHLHNNLTPPSPSSHSGQSRTIHPFTPIRRQILNQYRNAMAITVKSIHARKSIASQLNILFICGLSTAGRTRHGFDTEHLRHSGYHHTIGLPPRSRTVVKTIMLKKHRKSTQKQRKETY